jgi:hypothetical protein
LPCNGGDCSLPSFEIRDGIHEHYGVQFVFFFLPTSNQPEAGMEVVTVGAIYPAVVGSEPPDFFAPLLSCGRFLRTKFVDLRPAKSGLSRPQRRLAERKGRLMDISRVKTVCLRRRAESPHLGKGDRVAASVGGIASLAQAVVSLEGCSRAGLRRELPEGSRGQAAPAAEEHRLRGEEVTW